MAKRVSPHPVGLVASACGLASLLAFAFGALAPLRISTGTPVPLFAALGPWAALVIALWLVLFALSLVGARSHLFSLARGFAADALIVALVALSGVAANRVLSSAGPLARYSIGGGAWLSGFFAVTVVLASRREVGSRRLSLVVASLAPILTVALIAGGALSSLGMAAEYRNAGSDFWLWTGLHLLYATIAVTIAIVVGLLLGIAASRQPRWASVVFGVTSFVQTIPGLAMIGILSVPLALLANKIPEVRALGIGVLGWAPLVIALTLYALLSIVRNTFVGLGSVPKATVESAYAMGMTGLQVLRKVELPLAVPVIFSGIRTATQQTIGTATLGVFVAAATLGRPIFGGVSQTANDLVLLGSLMLVTLALSVDIGMRVLQRLLTPAHMRGGQ